jgi:hypothetical protein
MNNRISRRDIIRGLSALPLAMTLGPAQRAFSKFRISEPQSSNKTVQVCFQGLWAFAIHKDHIAAVTPSALEHLYCASGSSLPGGEYTLQGVVREPAFPGMEPAENLIVYGVKRINFSKAYLYMKLPFPKRVHSESRVPAMFKTSTCESVPVLPKEVPLDYCFEYASDGSVPQLYQKTATIPFQKNQLKVSTNLKKRAFSARRASDTFGELVELFDPLDLTLVWIKTNDVNSNNVGPDTCTSTSACGSTMVVQLAGSSIPVPCQQGR